MPYSDLSDAWNSYDPRYLRVSVNEAQGLRERLNEQEGEDAGDRRFDERMSYLNKRTNAYGEWTKQATIDEIQEAGPFGYPKFYMEPTPLTDFPRDFGYGYGYRENDIMPLPSSRDAGLDALVQESMARGNTPLREQELIDALHGARSGLPRSMSVEDLNNYISGQPINYLNKIGDTRGAAPPAPDDSEPPDWIKYYRQLISKIPEIGAPPQDEYIPDPERNYFTNEDIKRGRLQDLGIYAAPRSPPAGDVLLPREDLPEVFRPNNQKSTIWPGASQRMWDDLQIQNKLGTLSDDFKKFFYRSEQDKLLHGFGQQIEGDFPPSYLRQIGTRSNGFLGLR